MRIYRDHPASPDSIAKALSVGTLVSGTVAGTLDQPRITVRLIEPSGRQVDSRVMEARGGDLLALRSELTQEVAGFLRQRLGQEVKLRELRSAGDARAWVQVRRAEDLSEYARALYATGDTSAAQRTFDAADSLLAQAERPACRTGSIQLSCVAGLLRTRIRLADALMKPAITRWAPQGLAFAERALSRKPGYPPALELRGTLRLDLWLYSNKANRVDVEAAERDLRAAAVPENPSRARSPKHTRLLALVARILCRSKPDGSESLRGRRVSRRMRHRFCTSFI